MKPRSLFVVPWQPYPLYCGGALRAFHLARQLGRHFDTTVVFPVEDATVLDDMERDICRDIPGLQLVPVTIPSGTRSFVQRLKDRWATVQASGNWKEPSNKVSLALLESVKQVASKAPPQVVILTEVETLICSRSVRQLCPESAVVVDMHNVNHTLQGQYIAQNANACNGQFQRMLDRESNLARYADQVFACSRDDLAVFRQLNDDRLVGTVVPNGVDTVMAAPFDHSADKTQRRNIIYCASLTTRANNDGLEWFHREIWPLVRKEECDVTLNIVGGGHDDPRWARIAEDSSVNFSGRVPELRPHYAAASLAVCPLRIGSGTRLKILEAMSFGTPIVSTTLGCEGIAATDNEHLMIRDTPDQFAAAIIELLRDSLLFDRLRTQARQFVATQYDWEVIGDNMSQAINQAISRSTSLSTAVSS